MLGFNRAYKSIFFIWKNKIVLVILCDFALHKQRCCGVVKTVLFLSPQFRKSWDVAVYCITTKDTGNQTRIFVGKVILVIRCICPFPIHQLAVLMALEWHRFVTNPCFESAVPTEIMQELFRALEGWMAQN